MTATMLPSPVGRYLDTDEYRLAFDIHRAAVDLGGRVGSVGYRQRVRQAFRGLVGFDPGLRRKLADWFRFHKDF